MPRKFIEPYANFGEAHREAGDGAFALGVSCDECHVHACVCLDATSQLVEKVEAEFVLQSLGGALLVGQLVPSVVGFLGILEDVVDVLALAEKVVEIFRTSLVDQLQLVLEIVETVVAGCG